MDMGFSPKGFWGQGIGGRLPSMGESHALERTICRAVGQATVLHASPDLAAALYLGPRADPRANADFATLGALTRGLAVAVLSGGPLTAAAREAWSSAFPPASPL
eukprot:3857372-Alexandrium_andersonii.AAC.1